MRWRTRAEARAASAAAVAARRGLRRSSPATRRRWSGYPAAGTSSASARSPPANSTSAPLARSASATASAGTTWPAVPPAAISTRGALIGTAAAVDRPQRRAHALARVRRIRRDREQETHRAEQHHQVRVAVRHERERHAGERRHAHDREEVERRLAEHECGQAGGEQLRVAVARELRYAEAGVGDHPVERGEGADAEDAELLADDREDHVGVRLRQVEGLLHRLAEALAE